MNLQVNKCHYPVTALGPGRRVGIWVQGCSIRCDGCCSQDTWEIRADRSWSVADLVNWCRDVSANELDGVTITGGEPFEQPEALMELLQLLREWRSTAALGFDILIYSGLPWRDLVKRFNGHLELADAIVPEPLVSSRLVSNGLFGSSNQSVKVVSSIESVRRRFRDWQEMKHKNIQVQVDGEGIWFIGIPREGELQTLEQECARKGLTFSQVSWRS